MVGMDSEIAALAAVLEAEGQILKRLSTEGERLTDPIELKRHRVNREACLERFRRLNEQLAKRLTL